MKTLKELWSEAGEKPFDAVSKLGEKFHCVGISPNGRAIGWAPDGDPNWFAGEYDEWRVDKPAPELVPHWMPICEAVVPGCPTKTYLSAQLFSSVEDAKKDDLPYHKVVRLATELRPIMLEKK